MQLDGRKNKRRWIFSASLTSSFLLHRVTIFLQYVQTREKSENERSLCFYETFLISLPKIRELKREKILHEERRHVNPSFNKEKKKKNGKLKRWKKKIQIQNPNVSMYTGSAQVYKVEIRGIVSTSFPIIRVYPQLRK